VSILSEPHFHSEQAAYDRLESIIWPNGPVCPHCGGTDRITVVSGKTARPGLKRCLQCKLQFRATVGTVFESSHVPLHKWFQCAHLMASSNKGISAHQVHRTLKITYKTAWFMCHRLREAMQDGHFVPLGSEGKIVEIDETYIGGKDKNKHANKRRARGGMDKEIAFSLVERGGKARSHHVPSVSAKTLRPILRASRVGTEFAQHTTVNHSIGEYVRGDARTNTIEGYFSSLKRGITGVYHNVSQQHLKRYLAEFDFRYNERSALGVEDSERTTKALSGIVGKEHKAKDQSSGRHRFPDRRRFA
jgi:transposase-like protein